MWKDIADKLLMAPDLAFMMVLEDFYLSNQIAYTHINQEKLLHIFYFILFLWKNPLAHILGLYGDLGCQIEKS